MLKRLAQYRISIPYEGLLFLGGQSIVVLIAMAYANNLSFLFAFLVIGLILVSIVQCGQRIANLRIVQVHPLPIYADSPGEIEVYVHNGDVESFVGMDAMIETEAGWEKPKWKWGPKAKRRGPVLRAKGNATVIAPVFPKSRGQYKISRVQISSTFPFGIVRLARIFEIEREFFVYPKISGLQAWPEGGGVYAGEGEVGLGKGEDFTGHREYREGESQRHIDWKVYARTNSLYLKEFSGGAEEAVVFDWRNVAGTDSDSVASQLGKWLSEAMTRRIRFGVELPDARIDVGDGNQHFHRCMQQLAVMKVPR